MEAVERPKTGRGLRSRARRPLSRGGRQIEQLISDEEENGRPASRRGFTPETYEREDYDEFSRQNFVLERQMTPEYGTPLGLMSGHMSPQQHRNSPAFRDSPHSQRGYRPHRDSPLVNSPTHEEPPQHFGRPSSRKRGDMKESGRRYSSSSQQEDYHYGSSPAEMCYGSSSNYEHDDNRYLDQNTHINDGQESDFDHRRKSHEIEDKVLNIDNSWPTTPREKPPTARPKSSRKRLKSSRKKREEQDSQQSYSAVDTPILRPLSSLSKYKPLPAIGTTSPNTEDSDDISRKTQSMSLGLGERTLTRYTIDIHKKDSASPSENGTSRGSDRPDSVDQMKQDRRESIDKQYSDRKQQNYEHRDSGRQVIDIFNKNRLTTHELPQEPDKSEQRILLALRLPDGCRHQRFFRLSETMDLVLKFAENVSGMDLSEFRLACNAPRTVFADLTQLVGESGLQDRTVLYLEELD